MFAAQDLRPTLIGSLWPSTSRVAPIRAIILVLVGTALLTLSAKIQVPMYPVPMTMQTLAVLTLGVAYGWRLAGATILAYLGEAALGLPVLAGSWAEGGGLQHFVGPTAGYLAGFVVAAALVGWLAERGWDRSILLAGAAMLIGNLVIYVFGAAWLAYLFGWTVGIQAGVLPFLIGDGLKTALGACLLPGAWWLLGRK